LGGCRSGSLIVRPKRPTSCITLTATQQNNIVWMSLLVILASSSEQASILVAEAAKTWPAFNDALIVVLGGLGAYSTS
jgi:hypothetical protein